MPLVEKRKLGSRREGCTMLERVDVFVEAGSSLLA